MGCDIHVFVEVRGDGGEWRLAEPTPPVQVGEDKYDTCPPWRWPAGERRDYCEMEWFDHRDYYLFGLLSSVRRDPPWGCPTYGIINYGVPVDATQGYLSRIDGHTPCWVTLREWDEQATQLCDKCVLPRISDWLGFIEEIRPLGGPDDVRVMLFYDN